MSSLDILLIVIPIQGQYKSTLVCPICNKVSVTFDPFMYLSLPLPSTITRQMTITVFSSDGSALPMPYTVTVSKNGRCKDLIQALSTACCLRSSESLLVAEVKFLLFFCSLVFHLYSTLKSLSTCALQVHDHRIYRYMENMLESLSTIKDEDHIVAYRLPSNHREIPQIQIFHRSVEK